LYDDLPPWEASLLSVASSYEEWARLMQAPIPKAAEWVVHKSLKPE